MTTSVFFHHLTALREQLDQLVQENCSIIQKQQYLTASSLEILQIRQLVETKTLQARASLEEMDTHIFQKEELGLQLSLNEQIAKLSSQLDLDPENPDLWYERSLLWEEKGDTIAAKSDLMRYEHLIQNTM